MNCNARDAVRCLAALTVATVVIAALPRAAYTVTCNSVVAIELSDPIPSPKTSCLADSDCAALAPALCCTADRPCNPLGTCVRTFALPGDVVRVTLHMGTSASVGATSMSVNRIRMDLDCNSAQTLGLPCTDQGMIIEYEGDTTITTSCVTSWSTPGGAPTSTPNEIVFSAAPSFSMPIPATGSAEFCRLSFDVKLLAAEPTSGAAADPSPTRVEEVAGFKADASGLGPASDAFCPQNALPTNTAQTAQIFTCPVCADDDECTSDRCDALTGNCVFTPITCDDNNACTSDTCNSATGCVSTPAAPCNDNNACTTDTCSPATGCVSTPTAPCNDNNACTTDTCDPAQGCVSTAISCDDNNACTSDTCNPATGCVSTPIACDDNNACTNDTCDPATGCVAPPVAPCDDNNPCTADTCDAATGCVSTPISPVPDACACKLDVTKTACVSSAPSPAAACTGGAVALTLQYTGNRIDAPVTVTITGNSGVSVTYTLPGLAPGAILSKPEENGFTIDATAHGQSKLGSRTSVTINGALEVLHTSCSCPTPETNLNLCSPVCLDSSSPDNPTGTKGPPSPLWTLVGLKDPTAGSLSCAANQPGTCASELPAPTQAPACKGKIEALELRYIGGGCAAMNNSQPPDKVKCTSPGPSPGASPVRIRVTDKTGTLVWLDTGAANIAPGGTVQVLASQADMATLTGDTIINVLSAGNTLLEQLKFKTDCSQPINLNDVFGGFQVTSITTTGGTTASGAEVTYTYVITNVGKITATDITAHDDQLGDLPDTPIASLAPGEHQTITVTRRVGTTSINTVDVAGHANGAICNARRSAAVIAPCVLAYPYQSSNPLTSVDFNESEVLRAFEPSVAGPADTIRAFYNDEHALLLGVSGTGFPVSPFTPASGDVAGFVLEPQVGDPSATDPSGRPIFPALFITDITADPGVICTPADTMSPSRCHDWQFGGMPVSPSAVFGTWKAATTSGTSILTGSDPEKNNYDLDGIGPCTSPSATCPDPVPSGLTNQGYGAEVRWNVSDLGLTPDHVYRMQFMVHDGDQNKTGGDVGQGCATVFIPSAQ